MSQSVDLENALFILRTSLNNLQIAIESFESPVLTVSKNIYQNLTTGQILSLEKSFLTRANGLKIDLGKLNNQLSIANNIEDLLILQHNIQDLSNRYFLSEKVFDYYVDLLHTRSEKGMGKILKGCDQIATASLKLALERLGYEVPHVICHLDAGQGAAIIAAGIYLWDYQLNPAALIKVVRVAIPFPRLTSILHECGHQVAKMTGWNEELAAVLYSSIISAGYSKELAKHWSSCASELAADFYSLSQSNFASVVGLSEVLLGSANTMFTFIDNDPHPIGWSRIMLGIAACRTVLGGGPWNDYDRALDTLFPLEMAQPKSAKIIMESQPLLGFLCKTILNTKMDCFSGRSLIEILPWDRVSPTSIKNFLNKDQSDFSASPDVLMKNPILVLTCFRYIQMFGGRSQKWLTDKMRNWLISLSLIPEH